MTMSSGLARIIVAAQAANTEQRLTMDVAELLVDMYGRIPTLVHEVVDGLDTEQLLTQPGGSGNPIACDATSAHLVQAISLPLVCTGKDTQKPCDEQAGDSLVLPENGAGH